MSELTCNTPPKSVSPDHVRDALNALGLGFDGVETVTITASRVTTFWRDGSGLIVYTHIPVVPPKADS